MGVRPAPVPSMRRRGAESEQNESMGTRGMKRLSAAVLRDDTRTVVELLTVAMEDGIVTLAEVRAALKPAKRADQRAAYLHEVTAIGHALEREAVTPEYIADIAERLRVRAEMLPEPVPAA